jgi:hypothetical protein
MEEREPQDHFGKTTWYAVKYVIGGLFMLFVLLLLKEFIVTGTTAATYMVLKDASPQTISVVINNLSDKKGLDQQLKATLEEIKKEKEAQKKE